MDFKLYRSAKADLNQEGKIRQEIVRFWLV